MGTPLPMGFLKFKFYGASKGNTGPLGDEGLFQDSPVKILSLFSMRLGNNTKNYVKLIILLLGLMMEIEFKYTILIVEGDSQIITSTLRKIINKTPLE
jgi:hypothetical protein